MKYNLTDKTLVVFNVNAQFINNSRLLFPMSWCPCCDQSPGHNDLTDMDYDTEKEEGAPDNSEWLTKYLRLSFHRSIEEKLNCDRRQEKQCYERGGDAADKDNQLKHLQRT